MDIYLGSMYPYLESTDPPNRPHSTGRIPECGQGWGMTVRALMEP